MDDYLVVWNYLNYKQCFFVVSWRHESTLLWLVSCEQYKTYQLEKYIQCSYFLINLALVILFPVSHGIIHPDCLTLNRQNRQIFFRWRTINQDRSPFFVDSKALYNLRSLWFRWRVALVAYIWITYHFDSYGTSRQMNVNLFSCYFVHPCINTERFCYPSHIMFTKPTRTIK